MFRPILTSGFVHPDYLNLDVSINFLGVAGKCFHFYCILKDESSAWSNFVLKSLKHLNAHTIKLEQVSRGSRIPPASVTALYIK